MSLLDTYQYIRLAPETFQIIELTLAFPKDVDDHVTIIKQHPSARVLTLRRVGELSESRFDGFADVLG